MHQFEKHVNLSAPMAIRFLWIEQKKKKEKKSNAHLPPVNRFADAKSELLLSSYFVRLIPCAKGQPESERCVKYVPFMCPVPSQPEWNGQHRFHAIR